MNEYLIVKLLHVIGFAYWLGGDLGVFLSSFSVVNDKLSRDSRVTALQILFKTDQGPRISMTMMLRRISTPTVPMVNRIAERISEYSIGIMMCGLPYSCFLARVTAPTKPTRSSIDAISKGSR